MRWPEPFWMVDWMANHTGAARPLWITCEQRHRLAGDDVLHVLEDELQRKPGIAVVHRDGATLLAVAMDGRVVLGADVAVEVLLGGRLGGLRDVAALLVVHHRPIDRDVERGELRLQSLVLVGVDVVVAEVERGFYVVQKVF